MAISTTYNPSALSARSGQGSAIGNREDLSGLVAMLDAEKTPLLSIASRSKATATYHEWLIDKLDDLVHNAKAVPLTDQVRIDREEIYDILDQMRATIPEEIKQARWIVKERQEMLAEAKREAERLVKEAKERAGQKAAARASTARKASKK